MRRQHARFVAGNLFSGIISLNQNICALFFSHKVGFNPKYPMAFLTGDYLGYLYRYFLCDFGIPEHLTFDSYSSQAGRNNLFLKTFRKYDTEYHISSPCSANENPEEGSIREMKKIWYRIMYKNKFLERLWDYELVWISEIRNRYVSISRYASGRTPLDYING